MDKNIRISYIKFRIENRLLQKIYNKNELKSFLEENYEYIPEYLFNKALKELIDNNIIRKIRFGRYFFYQHTQKRRQFRYSAWNDIDEEKTFGVEIEFGSKIDIDFYKYILKDAGIFVQPNTKWLVADRRKYDSWRAVTDSSIKIDDYPEDVELVSPILKGKSGLKEIYLIFDILNRMKKYKLIKQNVTCGTHVHHSAEKLSMARFIDLAEKSQPAMDCLVSWTRIIDEENLEEDEGFFAPVKKNKYYIGNKIQWIGEKYVNISIRNYKVNKTIEFRQLQGTTNFKKLYDWIVVGQRLIKNAKRNEEIKEFKNLFSFYIFLGLIQKANKIKAYIK